jgi:hypothetical protein
MRIFSREELLGQWDNSQWRFTLYDENSVLLLDWKNGQQVQGTFTLFEDYLIFKYGNKFANHQWTGRIDSLHKNFLHLTDLSNDVGQKEKMCRTFFALDLIKVFTFNTMENTTIDHIKKILEVDKLHFNKMTDIDGKETSLYRHWENTSRFSVFLESDLVKKINDDKSLSLSITKKIKTSHLGFVTNFFITEYIYISEDEHQDYDDYHSYDKYNGAYGFDDYTIDSAFDGDPENYWNID